MGLADDFTRMVDALPDDWTDLEIDVRIIDESRYVDAAVIMVTCNAQPYSHHDWHWRVLVAHRFGHAAGVPAVHLSLKLLDDGGFAGEIVQREVRTGRAEIMEGWGRTESVRQEFKAARAVVRVVAFVPDLLFGSQVVGMLPDHEVVLVGSGEELEGALTGGEGRTDVLVVDLTDDVQARIAVVSARLPDLRSLAFYSHVQADVRTAAQAAGFDLVVPRSRMAREGAALVDRLAAA